MTRLAKASSGAQLRYFFAGFFSAVLPAGSLLASSFLPPTHQRVATRTVLLLSGAHLPRMTFHPFLGNPMRRGIARLKAETLTPGVLRAAPVVG
jgi:hypothetical protein